MEGLGGVVFLLFMGVLWLLGQVVEHKGKQSKQAKRVEPARNAEDEELELEQPRHEQPQRDVAQEARAIARLRRSEQLAASRAERAQAMRRVDPTSVKRSPVSHLFAGRANLRRAVIAMTVLGPPVSERPKSASPGEGAPL